MSRCTSKVRMHVAYIIGHVTILNKPRVGNDLELLRYNYISRETCCMLFWKLFIRALLGGLYEQNCWKSPLLQTFFAWLEMLLEQLHLIKFRNEQNIPWVVQNPSILCHPYRRKKSIIQCLLFWSPALSYLIDWCKPLPFAYLVY